MLKQIWSVLGKGQTQISLFVCSSPSFSLFLFLPLLQNSIRHNLSLHSRFVRVQNEGTGKSSWWMLNPEGGKSGKSPRRRAASMDNNSKFTKSRGRAAKKKVTKERKHLMLLCSEIADIYFLNHAKVLFYLNCLYTVCLFKRSKRVRIYKRLNGRC